MRNYLVVIIIASLILFGCYSTPITGGEAPVITTSKNFTMKEGWKDSFRLVESSSTTTHTILVSKVEPKAAMLKIDSLSLLMQLGDARSISLGEKTVVVTLDSIADGYARFSISLSPQGQQGGTQQGGTQGQQNGTQPTLKQNGATCISNAECQSNHCSNSYCCALGSCCLSDSNCSAGGKCNTTTYSCFSLALHYNGDSCNSNSDCQSNHCNNGHCCNSGKCCLSSSNCASGEICNITTSSCVSTGPTYTPLDAERKANSTSAGALISNFSEIFNTAAQCSSASAAYKLCIPQVVTQEDQNSPSNFTVTYSYSFNDASCCPTLPILAISVDLSTNLTGANWLDTTQTSSLAYSMRSALNSDCAQAVRNMIACKIS